MKPLRTAARLAPLGNAAFEFWGPKSAFYASLFGWQAEDLDAGAAGTYTMLRHRGEEVAIFGRQH